MNKPRDPWSSAEDLARPFVPQFLETLKAQDSPDWTPEEVLSALTWHIRWCNYIPTWRWVRSWRGVVVTVQAVAC